MFLKVGIAVQNLAVICTLEYDCGMLPRDRSGISALRDLAGLPVRLSGYSEAAMEYALRIRERAAADGMPVRVWALTQEKEFPQTVAGNLFAVGCDELVTLDCGREAAFFPRETGERLARALEQRLWDLVLLGEKDGDGCSASAGVFLARRLGVPYIGPLTDLWLEKDGLHYCRTLRSGEQQGVTDGPAVCALGNTKHPYLRMATLRERLAVMGRQAVFCETERPKRADPAVERLRAISSKRDLTWITGDSPEEQARQLLAVMGGKGGRRTE